MSLEQAGDPVHMGGSSTSPSKSVIGRIGSLEVRLATGAGEIDAALRLRHQVFHAAAREPAQGAPGCIDQDHFDAHCDHLIVIDSEAPEQPVVATYRLLPQKRIARSGGFYTESEFGISELLMRKPDLEFLEFGRSCVLEPYRDKRTVELLWHGAWSYVRHHGADVMFGCASFPGTDPMLHEAGLAFLARHAPATADWQVGAVAGRGIALSQMRPDPADLSGRKALRSLPAMIKGYLRLGAMFAGEAVIDEAFGTVDVLVILPVSRLNPRYVSHFGADADRHAG